MNKSIFNLTDEEKQERLDEHQEYDRQFWEKYTTEQLLNEVEESLQGCADPYCLACGNKNMLVATLRKRYQSRGGD